MQNREEYKQKGQNRSWKDMLQEEEKNFVVGNEV